MFKKRSLSIIALITVLVVMGTIGFIRIEQPKIIATCRSAMSSAESCGPWEYQGTYFFPLPVTVVFDDGVNADLCQVRRNGSEWQVIHVWSPGNMRLP